VEPRSLRFTFNVEPVGKARARVVVKNGRTMAFTPKRTAQTEDLIRTQVAEGTDFFEAGIPLRADLEFVIAKPPSAPKKRAYPVTKPDLDNLEKLVEDALERFLYANDAQIVEVHKRKVYGATPCIRLRLSEVDPAEFATRCAAGLDSRQEVLL
jgi:Holliday junction resolvase RusA-like endonuclease